MKRNASQRAQIASRTTSSSHRHPSHTWKHLLNRTHHRYEEQAGLATATQRKLLGTQSERHPSSFINAPHTTTFSPPFRLALQHRAMQSQTSSSMQKLQRHQQYFLILALASLEPRSCCFWLVQCSNAASMARDAASPFEHEAGQGGVTSKM